MSSESAPFRPSAEMDGKISMEYWPRLASHLDPSSLQRLVTDDHSIREQIAADVVTWMERYPPDHHDDHPENWYWNTRLHSYLNQASVLTLPIWRPMFHQTHPLLHHQPVSLEARVRAAVNNTLTSFESPIGGAPAHSHTLFQDDADRSPLIHVALAPASAAGAAAPACSKPLWEEMFDALNDKQRDAFNSFKAGANIFLTGSGGTGKSYVIEAIRQWVREVKSPSTCIHFHASNNASSITSSLPQDHEAKDHDEIMRDIEAPTAPILCECFTCSCRVVGPTGLCVLPFRGSTLHSFLGIGFGNKLGDWMRMPTGLFARRLCEVRFLVIEEVSMVSADRFDLIDQRLRLVRGKPNEAFGGVQLLVVGDFGQLPPVESIKRNQFKMEECEDKYNAFRVGFRKLLQEFFPRQAPPANCDNLLEFPIFRLLHPPDSTNQGVRLTTAYENVAKLYNALPVRGWGFAFSANAWAELKQSVLLDQPMRFRPAAGASASSSSSAAEVRQLYHTKVLDQLRVGDLQSVRHFDACVRASPPDDTLHLMYTNAAAKKRNLEQLVRNYSGAIHRYKHLTFKVVESFSQDASPQLERSTADLLENAERCANYDKELNDMALDEVLLRHGAPILLTRNLDMNPSKPVMLSNGSRGIVVGWTPIEDAIHELNNFIQNVHTSIDAATEPAKKVSLRNFVAKLERKKQFLQAGSDHLPPVLPYVKFVGPTKGADGAYSERYETIFPEVHELKDVVDHTKQHVVHKWRYQLPLKLGWAITVHKSQGMTLDEAYINNAQPAFTCGQLYVALSRVRTLERLILARPIDRASNLQAAPQVVSFYAAGMSQPAGERIDWIDMPTQMLYARLWDVQDEPAQDMDE